MSGSVTDIAQRVAEGKPVLEADARALSASPDLVTVGMLADTVRARLHGDRVTYVRVLEMPADGTDPSGEVPPAGEVRIVGAPASVEAAIARWQAVAAWAGAARVTAFDLADLIAHDASLGSWRPLARVGGTYLAQASLDRLPDPVAAMRAAAALGFTVGRLTVARTSDADLVTWALVANGIGRLDLGVHAFAPLALELAPTEPTTGYQDSKRVAIARLVCDRIPSIQVDWRTYGPKLAQVALFFGADDMDRVSTDDSAPLGPRRSPMEELRRNLEAASRRGAERTARFEVRA
jgi:hypothetical protein